MEESISKFTQSQQRFIYWVKERERVRLAREAGQPKPWSADPIFQVTYFCNVYREKDKVTKWIRENWTLGPNYELAMLTARIFNLPECLADIMYPSGDLNDWLDTMLKRLYRRQARGIRCWNGAYIISTNGQRVDKAEHCVGLLRMAIAQLPPIPAWATCRAAHNALQGLNGIGSFLAAQVVADLKNTKDYSLYRAPDWATFAAPGPGSLRGLSWFWERKITPATFDDAIRTAKEHVKGWVPEMCMQDFQNCMCEYDKYMRVLNGTGRSKRKYNGNVA